MKKLLIISPHFPPFNGADMHRVRQTLPFLRDFGWDPTVIIVDTDYIEGGKDDLLLATVPQEVRIILVKAFAARYTRKVGLGSLALRSIWFYWKKVNKLLAQERFDLIYFSTTQFPLLILGNFWKVKFGIPYVIDMQDPWHTDYYLDKPKSERPPKFWFSYRLNKYLEPIAMKRVNGLIAVSQSYINTLLKRYSTINSHYCKTITFGAFQKDFEIADNYKFHNIFFDKTIADKINVLYVGRGGHDMRKAVELFFQGFKLGLKENYTLFSQVHFYFIGTSYAPNGKGDKTILPIAEVVGISEYVTEDTDRVPYFEALNLLKSADILFIPGSDDPKYTASKLYPYILAKKPLLALFNEESSVIEVLQKTKAGLMITFGAKINREQKIKELYKGLEQLLEKLPFIPSTNWEAFAPHTAQARTMDQVKLFDQILSEL